MISIVTITFNNPEELQRTLASLPDIDTIESVIINGGDDKKAFDPSQKSKMKIVNEKDAGIADAFNKGIMNSSGSAIMFLNSGDILLDKEYLNEAEKFLENKDVDFIHSNLLYNDRSGVNLVMKPRMKNPGRGMPFLHPTMIIKKKVFSEIGNFNDKYKIAMDFDFVLRLLNKNYKGVYINSNPVVEMDGKGKSASFEHEAIKECRRSLIENNLYNIQNRVGLLIRYMFFYFRKILIKTGAGNFLGFLKKIKYSV